MNCRFTVNTPVRDVMSDPAFGAYGRLLFPVHTAYWGGKTLGKLHLAFYGHIDPNKTVEIVNTLKGRALAGETVFYDIYTDREKGADAEKAGTGLFFFKGRPGARFAVCNAGGALPYQGLFRQRGGEDPSAGYFGGLWTQCAAGLWRRLHSEERGL